MGKGGQPVARWLIFLIGAVAIAALILALILFSRPRMCTTASHCNDDDPCTQDFCRFGFCENLFDEPDNCSFDFQCKEEFGDNGACESCMCKDLCAEVDCDTSPCFIEECVRGMCTIKETIPGCCDSNDDCQLISNRTCVEAFCNANNKCEEHTLPGRECSLNEQCTGGDVCSRRCRCVDPCQGVQCNSDICTQRECIRPSGECVVVSQIPNNCCLRDVQCERINICFTPRCRRNRCEQELIGVDCGFDGDCNPGHICENCMCIPDPFAQCFNSSDCDDRRDCTIDICNAKTCACEHIEQANCCETDTDCRDGDLCTEDTCILGGSNRGRCIHTQLDKDGDGFPCNVDCDDDNGRIGGPHRCCRDSDGDGSGASGRPRFACNCPRGFISDLIEGGCGDCDDTDPTIFWGSRVCNETILNDQLVLRIPDFRVPPCDTFDRQDDAFFGGAVAIYKDVIVVCSRASVTAKVSGRCQSNVVGAAYVFRRDGEAWVFEQRLTPNDTTGDIKFCQSVDIRGTVIVIGAPESREGGAAYVYEFDGASWPQTTRLRGLSQQRDELFGWAVSVSTRGILVGAPDEDNKFDRDGAAYFFVRDTPWIFSDQFFASDGTKDDRFGVSVALDNFTAVIGAAGHSNITNTGAAYVFDCTTGICIETQKLIASDGSNGDGFGISVEVDLLTGVILAGASGRESVLPFLPNTGAIYVFKQMPVAWTETQILQAPDRDGSDNCAFGPHGAGVRNDTIVMGCRNDEIRFDVIGSANVFEASLVPGNDNFNFVGKMTGSRPFDTRAQEYGRSVDTWEGTIVVGAPNTDTRIHGDIGAAYVTSCIPIPSCP